ncbi:putative patatin [Blastococcus saxobsidens DD2]|uniref:Putative patatin n=1 Tax=Blastococcus saxobsidens (strain DD2) TaxID=1146883 RepID=H6RJX5_BLASD|nr:putative patatin [Blastococcus saxobsidens DD2]
MLEEVELVDEPVRRLPGESPPTTRRGTALCLSGGGYRAMVFHVGVLWRLNQAGLLARLDRVSSVSGGSLAAGVLGLHWSQLRFDAAGIAPEADVIEHVVEPVRHMARQHVDVSAVLTGAVLPFTSISDRVIRAYQKHLFGEATLQDLPDEPRFVINATNLQSGVLMRFSKPYLGDHRVGRVVAPDLPLAVAVAASSAFPPVLSPCTVDLGHEEWVTDDGNDLAHPSFRGEVRLSDGGVYDNLGLETAWKRCARVLISDAGGRMAADDDPPDNWAGHMHRVLDVIDNQVRSLRKRQAIAAFAAGRRTGMYVGIRSQVGDYPVAEALQAAPSVTARLAAIPTRLDRLDDDAQERLINWGYVICDTGLRSFVDRHLEPGSLPYPEHPLTEEQRG